METITIIGTLAALLTTIPGLPQAYKIIKEKTSEGVSPVSYIVLLSGTILWVVYGVMKSDWPIIISNAISSLVSITILILYAASDRKIEKLHDTIISDDKIGKKDS